MSIDIIVPEIDIEAENKEIVRRYRRLLRSAKPVIKDKDATLIRKAFELSMEAHKEMRRKSGEPYIYHPIAVAQICVEEIGLGTTSIIAALLHDVVEDTNVELKEIEKKFGPKVASIIDGLTKISGTFSPGSSSQAENFRKMLLTLADDVRVILIKLADRLHNMRTMDSMPRNTQLKIASETIFLYAPLAHRLGLYPIKSELEDLYLKYTHTDQYFFIADKIQQTKAVRTKFINEFIAPIDNELKKQNFKFAIKGRPKSIFSINNKLQKQKIPFEEIYDLFAIRIIVDCPLESEKSACWQVYSVVTDFYKPNPDRLRDWISTPKQNGYESLHTTVMSKSGNYVEVQIRTNRMDEISEKGYAAHWKYKENTVQSKEVGLEAWLVKVRDVLEASDSSAIDFVNDFRSNLFNDEVYAFTPNGELKVLPAGATALDFAFEIHTQVGLNCLGAKVNQKLVPISHKITNGDQIEILTSKKQKPTDDWLKIAVTSRAKAKIKDALREDKKVIAATGKEILERKLKHLKYDMNEALLTDLRTFFNLKTNMELFYRFGISSLQPQDLKRFKEAMDKNLTGKPLQNEVRQSPIMDSKSFEREIKKIRGTDADMLLIGEDMNTIDYTLAKCCNPIPGDDVFGFVTVSEGIKIHRTVCPNAVELMSSYGYRIIKAKWTSQTELSFLAGLRITGTDRMGMVNDITKVISNELQVNMRGITIDTNDGIFEGQIMVYVNNAEHLTQLVKKLKAIMGVVNVFRFDS